MYQMAPQKKVTFANQHGQSLTQVKHIDREGRSMKLAPSTRKFKSVTVTPASLEQRRKLAKEQAKRQVIAAESEIKQIGIQQKKAKNVEKAAMEMYDQAKKQLLKAQAAKGGNKTALVNSLSKTVSKSMGAINQLSKHQAKLNEVKQNSIVKLNMAKQHLNAQKRSG
ncbi:hypothetical protein ATCVOR07043_99L [Acanthocystis turfacea Chlorella virus OR0704.3]|nr:hypothetical protein ATCVOR07043_99L [Acanthocystis turfacea Chlorella virus OR0704.3]